MWCQPQRQATLDPLFSVGLSRLLGWGEGCQEGSQLAREGTLVALVNQAGHRARLDSANTPCSACGHSHLRLSALPGQRACG